MQIPTDMDRWAPHDVTAWLDENGRTPAARKAATAALLGDELADEIHAPI